MNSEKVVTPETGNQNWDNYYQRKEDRFNGPENYLRRRFDENIVYLDLISEALGNHKKLGILGGGAGMEAVVFSMFDINCTVIDIEHPIHERIRKTASLMNAGETEHIQGDALYIPLAENSLDVICSHGLLEHFHDRDMIINSIVEAMRVADTYVCVVPTDKAGNPNDRASLQLSPITSINQTGNFGDEDYRPAEEWKEIIEEAAQKIPKAQLSMTFGYWIPKFKSTFIHPKDPQNYFGKGIFAGFVITKKP